MLTGRALARLAGAGVLGVAIGIVGTTVHRLSPPLGLVLALLTVLVGAVLVRAWTGGAGMFALALGLVTTVGVLGQDGPGGDVLIAAQPIGYVWYVGVLMVPVAALLPSAWFSDRPRQPGRHHERRDGGRTDGT